MSKQALGKNGVGRERERFRDTNYKQSVVFFECVTAVSQLQMYCSRTVSLVSRLLGL